MSTKKLERTVIEGGRFNRNKYERRHSNKEQRAIERAYMADLRKNLEFFDEEVVEDREHVYKGFSDKLGPMYRWIDAQVGRKWNEVRSEIFEKFDTKTTAGRHITFDHLLSSITDTLSGRDSRGRIAANYETYSNRYHEYYVDDNGFLRKNSVRDHSEDIWRLSQEELDVASNWLANRMIGNKGGRLYWFTSTDSIWKAKFSKEMEITKYGPREGLRELRYYCLINSPFLEEIKMTYFNTVHVEIRHRTGEHWEYIENPAGFKQRGELTKDEAKFFKSLHKGIQSQILAFGKARF